MNFVSMYPIFHVFQESESPLPSCMTILVNGPENGDIQADPTTLCPDETSTITVADSNADPALSEYIIIINSDGVVVQIVEALTTTLTYDQCGVFTAYYYSFVTADNPLLPMVERYGHYQIVLQIVVLWMILDITFEDTEEPVFSNVPADVTVECAEDMIEDEAITWTDNCAGTGTVLPVVVEDYTLCDGGTIERTWSFTDSCANTETYTQNH